MVWNGTEVFEYSLEDITADLGADPQVDTVSPVLWRGIKARKINDQQSELLILNVTGEFGVIRVVFGGTTMGVENWSVYAD